MRTKGFLMLAASVFAWMLFAFPSASSAAAIAGRGTLSGSVKAPKPFQAARVYARHKDKNVIFMVYTNAGRFQAVNLFPGAYEVWVEKEGFESDPQTLEIEPGKGATVEISLREGSATPSQLLGGMGAGGAQGQNQPVPEVPYDGLFPNEPGRQLAERSCIYCHGENFISRNPKSREEWAAAIKMMTEESESGEGYTGAMLPRNTFTEQQWKTLEDYLTKHFGPGAPRRSLKAERTPMPLDEPALSKAQWIEYRLANNVGPFKRRRAQEPYLDNKGNVWFTERGNPSAVSRLNPRTAEVKDYMNPVPTGSPHGLVADREGFIWWAGRDVYLGRIHPGTGEIVQYPVARKGDHGHTPVLDSKDNIWFSMLPGNKIGKFDKATQKISLLNIPTEGGRPYGIFVDPKDRIWFAEFHTCKVGMYDPATAKFAEYTGLTTPCRIRRLGMDPKGNVWYGGNSTGKVGRVDPATGRVTEFDMPAQPSQPYDVWPDKQGNIWITDDGPTPAAMVKLDPNTKKFTYYPSVQQADMPKVAISHDGGIWYSPRSSPNAAAVGVFYPDVSKMEEAPYFGYPERR